jgi:seryl-tRNA synthetase
MNKEINKVQKEIGALMKSGKKDEAQALLKKKDELAAQKVKLEEEAKEKEVILNSKLNRIGNLVHDTVIISDTEDKNGIVKKWWPEGASEEAEVERRQKLLPTKTEPGVKERGVPGLYPHSEVLEKIEGYDPERGTKISGHRGFFLMGAGVDFNLALMQYGLDFLQSKGYTKLWTPFFMKKEMMAKTAQLEEFDEALYKVSGEGGKCWMMWLVVRLLLLLLLLLWWWGTRW